MNIDSSTVFDNNVVEENGEHYGGGGALWMIDITPSSNVQVDATFTNNVDHFGHGMRRAPLFYLWVVVLPCHTLASGTLGCLLFPKCTHSS